MSPAKKTAKPTEPQITWRPKGQGTTFTGTIGDIIYLVISDTADDGGATWITAVQLSDNTARTLEEAKDLAEKDLS